jgi:hypothetical protein
MRRWTVPGMMVVMGISSAIAAQNACDCSATALQPVVQPAPLNVRYTSGVVKSVPAANAPALLNGYTVPYSVPPPPGAITYRPLVPIAQTPASYYMGRGILGQPKVYVPGQPVLNFFRYLSP